jgi:ketosteroid isomerase-like protein
MGAAENIQTVKSVYEAFGRADLDAILAVVADDADWGTDTSSSEAPWWGIRTGKEAVAQFFVDLGKTTETIEFTPLAFAANDDGDVMTVVRFATRMRETGKTAEMNLHHWFHFRDGKIAKYRGTEDTAVTLAALT